MVSVVIISYQRAAELWQVLDDLARQHHAPPFEVVLVLQGYPAEAVDRIRRDFGTRLCLRIHDHDQRLGISTARTVGVSLAEYAIIAFIDDDVRVPVGWAAALLPPYTDPTVGGVGGYANHPGWGDGVRKYFHRAFRLRPSRYTIDRTGFHLFPSFDPPDIAQDADWLSGCNMSFRREVLEEAGGFTDIYGHSGWFDDVDLSVRVRRLGYRLVTTPTATVDHLTAPGGRDGAAIRAYTDERHRVLFARRAIHGRPLWRTRYVVRFTPHLLALTLVACVQRQWRSPWAAIRGMVAGLRDYSHIRP
jgi:GT2 family glycosyltransferase